MVFFPHHQFLSGWQIWLWFGPICALFAHLGQFSVHKRLYKKPACICVYTQGCVCFGVCVFSLAPLGGVGVPRFDGVRRWVVAFGPHLPGSALRSRNLSCGLLRQWEEHVKPWHMVAWVTCSLCLALIFRASAQTRPTQWHLYCSTWPALWEHPLFTVGELFVHHTLFTTTCAHSPAKSSSWLMMFCVENFCFCVFAVCLCRQKARPLPSNLHPSTVLQLQPGKPDFQVSHPHVLDCSLLTCANIKERERERKGEREREWARGWKGVKWKNIPAFGYWVGCREE